MYGRQHNDAPREFPKAELKVLSAIETKVPGNFKRNEEEVLDRDRDGDWGTSCLTFEDEELSYALGKQGATRKKLEQASECIVQYVGNVALLSGYRKERHKAKEYLSWLFAQLEGPVWVDVG